jgi:hypothetical protein
MGRREYVAPIHYTSWKLIIRFAKYIFFHAKTTFPHQVQQGLYLIQLSNDGKAT